MVAPDIGDRCARVPKQAASRSAAAATSSGVSAMWSQATPSVMSYDTLPSWPSDTCTLPVGNDSVCTTSEASTPRAVSSARISTPAWSVPTQLTTEASAPSRAQWHAKLVGAPPRRVRVGNTSQSSSPIPATRGGWFMGAVLTRCAAGVRGGFPGEHPDIS